MTKPVSDPPGEEVSLGKRFPHSQLGNECAASGTVTLFNLFFSSSRLSPLMFLSELTLPGQGEESGIREVWCLSVPTSTRGRLSEWRNKIVHFWWIGHGWWRWGVVVKRGVGQ